MLPDKIVEIDRDVRCATQWVISLWEATIGE
jgi:hypothetical protein